MKTRLIAYLLAFLTVLSLAVDVGADTVVNVTTRGDLEHAVQTGELEGYDVYLAWYHSMFTPGGKDESFHAYCDTLLHNHFSQVNADREVRTAFLKTWAYLQGKTELNTEIELYETVLLKLISDNTAQNKKKDGMQKAFESVSKDFLSGFVGELSQYYAKQDLETMKKILFSADLEDRAELREAVLRMQKQEKEISETWKVTNGIFDVFFGILDVCENYAQFEEKMGIIYRLVAGEYTGLKIVFKELSENAENKHIRDAASELYKYLTSEGYSEMLNTIIEDLLGDVKNMAYEYVNGLAVDTLWKVVGKYNPGIKIGLTAADALFDLTGEAESIYMLNALCNLEDAMFDAALTLKNNFKLVQDNTSANAFVTAMDLCYRFAFVSTSYVDKHLDVYFNSGLIREWIIDQEAKAVYEETLTDSIAYITNAHSKFYSVPQELYDEIFADLGNVYTIKYNANGGSGAPADQVKKFNETVTLSSTEPKWEGYAFAGWAKQKTAKTYDYLPGDTYKANESITLYAVWHWVNTETVPVNTTYIVTYYANAPANTVSNLPASQSKQQDGSVKISSKVPVRDGYTFKGWSTSSIATEPDEAYAAGKSYSANSNLSLYAVWNKKASSGGLAGDINEDGIVNNQDLIRFREYLDGKNVYVDPDALNVDGTGGIDEADFDRLYQHLTGWAVKIFYGVKAADPITFTVTHSVQGDILALNVVKIVNGDGYMTWTVKSSHAWKVVSSEKWCTFSTESGAAGETTLILNFTGTTTDKRDVLVTFTVNGVTKTVTVRQQKAKFTVQHNTLGNILSANAVELENVKDAVMQWKVKSDFDWRINSTTGGWFSISPTSGKANQETTVTLKTLSTVSTGKREGDVTFYVNGDSYVVVLYQQKAVSNTPDAPTGLKAVNGLKGTVELTWNKVDDADGYAVYRKIKGQTFWEADQHQVQDTEFVDTNAKVGTTYVYMVRAYKEVGAKAYFSEDSNTAEMLVYKLSFQQDASLFWTAKSMRYVAVEASAAFSISMDSAAKSWLKCTADQEYSDIVIEALTANYSSKPRTAEITVVCGNASGTITVSQDACGEGKPTLEIIDAKGLVTISNGKDIGSITGTELKFQTCTSYVRRMYIEAVKVSGSDGTNKTVLLNGEKNVYTDHSLSLNGLSDGKYKVTVFASNSDIANSQWAQQANTAVFYFTKTKPDPVKPDTPTNVKATAIDQDSVKITWNSVKGAEGYIVSRRASNEAYMQQITDTSNTSWTDNTCKPGTKYYYGVAAYIGDQYSNASKIVNVTTPQGLGTPAVTLKLGSTVLSNGYTHANYYTGGDICYLQAKVTNTHHFFRSFEGDASQNFVWDDGTFENDKYIDVWVKIPSNIPSGTYKIEVRASNSAISNDPNAKIATAYMYIKIKN